MNLLSTSSTAGGLGFTLIYIVVICAVMWFLLVRPQKKEQKRVQLMLSELAVGDTVLKRILRSCDRSDRRRRDRRIRKQQKLPYSNEKISNR